MDNAHQTSVVINGTKYIPAKEAEVGFLLAILGIVTGIVLGFVVLKANGLPTFGPRPISVPAQAATTEEVFQVEETIPVESRDIPLFQFTETEDESEGGQRDITV